MEVREFELYDPTLCSKRWTKIYYEESHPALQHVEKIDSPNSTSFTRIRCPDEKDKYKKAATVTKEINNLACTMSESKHKFYLEKLTALRNEMLGGPEDYTEDNLEDYLEDQREDHPEDDRNETRNAPCGSRMMVLADVHVGRGSENSAQLPTQSAAETRSVQNYAMVDLDEITVASTNELVEAPNEIVEVGESSCFKDSTQSFPIKLPNKIVQIGRPKGSGLTVIGTQRKVKNVVNIKSKQIKITKDVPVADVPKSKKRRVGHDGDDTVAVAVADVPVESKKRRLEKGVATATIKKFIDLSSKEQGSLIVKWLTNYSAEELQMKKVIKSVLEIIERKLIF